MVTGMVRQAQVTDSRKVRIWYEKEKGRSRWCPLWDNNPRIAHPSEQGDFQILEPRTDYLRPYCSKKTDKQWDWKSYTPPVGEIYFHQYERAFGDLNRNTVVLEPNLKGGASPNKQWSLTRWCELALLLGGKGLDLVTVGNSQHALPGVRHIPTTIRQAAALIARARGVVVPEGALHHIAAVVGTPAVVIYGGYISPQVTGYEGQTAFFTGDGLGCGMRVPCKHCAGCMEKIRADDVAAALLRVLRA